MGLKVAIQGGLQVTYQIENSDKQANIENIRCRIPQGSILGPLLFLIFVNDLHKVRKYLDPIMFADDTNLFLFSKKYQNTIPNR